MTARVERQEKGMALLSRQEHQQSVSTSNDR